MCLMSVKLREAAMACELSWYPQGVPLHFMCELSWYPRWPVNYPGTRKGYHYILYLRWSKCSDTPCGCQGPQRPVNYPGTRKGYHYISYLRRPKCSGTPCGCQGPRWLPCLLSQVCIGPAQQTGL